MKRILAAAVLCGAAIGLVASFARAQEMVPAKPAVEAGNVQVLPVAEPDNVPKNLDTLPPAPRGKTTIIGGQIRSFDPVRDQFSLQIYGQRPMKIWFDERTQVYRDPLMLSAERYGQVRRFYIEGLQDRAISTVVQRQMTSHMPCEGIFTLDTDHSPFLCAPTALAETLEKIVHITA